MTVRVPLTKGCFALIDDADAPLVLAYHWQANYSRRYAVGIVDGRQVRMHRFLMGAPADREVDHANGDGLDNRRSNLRIATPSQNKGNRRKGARAYTSRYKGVFRRSDRTTERWHAAIHDGRRRWLGSFLTEEDAARAYDRAALAKWGEFALLNLPDEVLR